MDLSTREKILNKINDLDKINLENVMGEVFKDHDNIQDLTIEHLSVEEFYNLYKRVLLQLKDELENGYWTLLPDQYNFNNEFGSGSLYNQLIGLEKELNTVELAPLKVAEVYLKTIAYYEIINGFFDKSNRKIHDLRGIRVTETENKLNLMIEQFNNNLDFKKTLFVDLGNK